MHAIALFFYQTLSLFIKNVLFSIRHFFVSGFQILVPSFILLILYASTRTLNNGQPVAQHLDSLDLHKKGKEWILVPLGPFSQSPSELRAFFNPLLLSLADLTGRQLANKTYDGDDFADCPARSICAMSVQFPETAGYLQQLLSTNDADIAGLVALEADSNPSLNRTFDYSVMRNVTASSPNPFIINGGGGGQHFDRGLDLQKVLFQAAYAANAAHSHMADVLPSGKNTFSADVTLHTFPVTGDIDPVAIFTYPLLFVAVFISTIFLHFKINDERNTKLRHGLILNGMKESSYWCSWLLSESVIVLLSVGLMLMTGVLLKYEFFVSISFFALLLIFFLYSLTMVINWMLFATCCQQTLCTIISAFLFASFTLGMVEVMMVSTMSANAMLTTPVIFLCQVFPVFNWGKLLWDVKLRVDQYKYFHFVDLFKPSLLDETRVLLHVIPPYASLLIMVAECIVGFLFVLYFDHVLPSDEKVAKPFYFCLNPAYWGLASRNDRLQVDSALHDENRAGSVIVDLDNDIAREYQSVVRSVDVDADGTAFPLKIVKISKTFSKWYARTNATIALTGVTLAAKRGDVLVLLGHNGAGKTTLVNILTGVLPVSTGDALVFSRSVTSNIEKIRMRFGICPQYDIVVPALTVQQHLFLYASLKGIAPWDPQLNEILEYLELSKLKHQTAANCSGGEKRRLTFACAVIGNPQAIFLDEPSSGLDPVRRRKMWDYINKIKKDKVVVLTTHSMEEADMIGDKIAFFALGRLRAIGTAAHLKRRFGCGYQMDVVLEDHKGIASFKDQMRALSSRLVVQNELNCALTYSLPFTVSRESKLAVFQFLDECNDAKTIKSFQLSHTTLEEVFMNVTHGNAQLMQGLEDHDVSELAVMLEHSEEPFTSVSVSSTDSLTDIREHLTMNCPSHVAPDFLFLSQSSAMLKSHETLRLARTFLPLIRIRVFGAPRPSTGGHSVEVVAMNPPGSRDRILEGIIQEKDAQLQHQAAEILALKERLEAMERAMAKQKGEEGS